MQLYDTLERTIKPLRASDGRNLRIYCCGPTVYGPAHIGNFRTFVMNDVLRRTAEVAGLNPRYVRNITDVDDKTIAKSQEEGVPLIDFTRRWTKKFHDDCEKLNLLAPDNEPCATDHIPEQIALVEKLVADGSAYVTDDGSVYFKVASFGDYGKLSHFSPEDLRTQETNSAGQANLADEYSREAIADFAVWKARKEADGDVTWHSPWGEGRPGWHLECSAMSMKYLGETFDLHTGGEDLCFPHHENEIAQSESATGKPFAHHWAHFVHLLVEGKKMSKSLGNFYVLDDLLEKGAKPMAIRYLMVSGHYRQQLNFTMNGLHAADSALAKLEKAVANLLKRAGLAPEDFAGFMERPFAEQWGHFGKAWTALEDDLNTSDCLGQMFSALKTMEQETLSTAAVAINLKAIATLLYCLGLEVFQGTDKGPVEVPVDIRALADERWEAKKARDFGRADQLREDLSNRGWVVTDSKDGYAIEPV